MLIVVVVVVVVLGVNTLRDQSQRPCTENAAPQSHSLSILMLENYHRPNIETELISG